MSLRVSRTQARLLSAPFELFPVPFHEDPFGVDSPGALPEGLARGRSIVRPPPIRQSAQGSCTPASSGTPMPRCKLLSREMIEVVSSFPREPVCVFWTFHRRFSALWTDTPLV